MTATGTNPLNVQCDNCDHVWAVAYLPMELTKAAELMRSAACPKCGERERIFMAEGAI